VVVVVVERLLHLTEIVVVQAVVGTLVEQQ
jgi:hypothetical protein